MAKPAPTSCARAAQVRIGAGRCSVKAGIPDLPVSGFPKAWASLVASARYKEGTPGLPVPRIPKGWLGALRCEPDVKRGIPGLPVPRSPKRVVKRIA